MDPKASQTLLSGSERPRGLRFSAAWHAGVLMLGAGVIIVTVAAGPAITPDGVKNILASGPAHDKVVQAVLSAPGPVTDEYTPPPDPPAVGETTIDLTGLLASQSETSVTLQQPTKAQQCAAGTIAPQIFKAKGKLTSGGYLVLEGACFGNNGTVELGGFPKGDPHVTNEAWTPTAITVQLPTISGVPDLTMHIQVKRTLTSKVFDAKYTAAIGDPVELPPSFIKSNECAANGICIPADPALAIHVDSTSTNGADVWTVTIPAHFHLHAIKLHHTSSGHASTSTINASSSAKTIEISWAEKSVTVNVPETITSTTNNGSSSSSIWEDLATGGAAALANSGTTTTTTTTLVPTTVWVESYRFDVQVRGPAGMSPI
jgi:hypothetical protein